MLLITKDKVTPVDLVPSIYLEDEDYLMLPKNPDLRERILDSLGLELVIVGRLGKEITQKGTFEKDIRSDVYDDYDFEKEVGLYIGL